MRKELNLKQWGMNQIPLKVPFEEKDVARSIGATWCGLNKLWFINTRHYFTDSQKQRLLDAFPFYTKAEINLIPETCWYSNLRSMLPKEKWDVVRKKTYSEQGMTCEFCRGKFSAIQPEKKHPVEAHELWYFDDIMHTQTLIKVLCLCPDCHLTQHLGFANTQGLKDKVMSHFQKVAKISEEEANNIAADAFSKWKERSEHEWSINLDWLYQKFPDITEEDVTLDR